MFVIVTLLAIPCGYVAWQADIVRQRQSMRAKIVQAGGGLFNTGPSKVPTVYMYFPPKCQVSWLRRQLGDEAVGMVQLPQSAEPDDDAIERTFPEAYHQRFPQENLLFHD